MQRARPPQGDRKRFVKGLVIEPDSEDELPLLVVELAAQSE